MNVGHKSSYLNLHPAAHIVSGKVSAHHVQHVNGERSEGDRLFVLVMPSAPKFAGLIPDLLNLRIILDNDGVFKVSSGAGIGAITIQAILSVSSGTTGVDGNVEFGVGTSQTSGQVDAVNVAVVSLAEDDTVEGFVKFNVDLHQVLLASHVQASDLGHVSLGFDPSFISTTRGSGCGFAVKRKSKLE